MPIYGECVVFQTAKRIRVYTKVVSEKSLNKTYIYGISSERNNPINYIESCGMGIPRSPPKYHYTKATLKSFLWIKNVDIK